MWYLAFVRQETGTTSDAVRGFVLTPTYRVRRGAPEVWLYGRLEDGEPCLIIDDRQRPYFFAPADCGAEIRRLGAGVEVVESPLRTFSGAPVVAVHVAIPGEVPAVRRRLETAGIACLEADVRFAYRYLIDRQIHGAFAVRGTWTAAAGAGRGYRHPETVPARWGPVLRVLAIDVETSPRGERLYSIALHSAGFERVLMVYDRPVAGAEVVPTEEALLRRFLQQLRAFDPDVLTGWNVVDFDLLVLQRRCRRFGIRCVMGRTEAELEIRRDASFTRESRAVLEGRLVLDGLSLMRGAFVKLEDYKLETAARVLLGKGKLIAGPARHVEIESAYRNDPQRLAAYNLNDARLVTELLERTGVVELAIHRSLLTGMPLDRVGAAIASVDALYLGAARGRGIAVPSVCDAVRRGRYTGGYVLESRPGLY